MSDTEIFNYFYQHEQTKQTGYKEGHYGYSETLTTYYSDFMITVRNNSSNSDWKKLGNLIMTLTSVVTITVSAVSAYKAIDSYVAFVKTYQSQVQMDYLLNPQLYEGMNPNSIWFKISNMVDGTRLYYILSQTGTLEG
jgi:hypothetical protein